MFFVPAAPVDDDRHPLSTWRAHGPKGQQTTVQARTHHYAEVLAAAQWRCEPSEVRVYWASHVTT